MGPRKDSQAATQDEGFCSMEAGPSHRYDDSNASFARSSQSYRKKQSKAFGSFDSGNAYSGIIHKFTVKNFMCHAHLSFKFNPKSNFIIGKNGSGKSAIQTAICICLGANAKSTNRAGALSKLIRTGCSSASIELVLNNCGERSYKPDIFGNNIIVTRTINDSGSSSFKLKSETGVTVSTKKEDLTNMLNTLQIQIFNPISMLNQDSARTFFASTDASKKYSFFLQGTQIDEMNILMDQAKGHKQAIQDNLQMRISEKEIVAQEMNDLLEKKKKLDKIRNYQEKRELLEVEFFWAEYHQCRKKMEEQQTNLTKQKAKIEEMQESLNQKTEQEAEIKAKIEELKTILDDQRNKIKEYNDLYQQKKQSFRNLRQQYANKESEVNTLENNLTKKKSDLSQTQEEILRLESIATQNDDRLLEARRKREQLNNVLKSMHLAVQEVDREKQTLRNTESDTREQISRLNDSKNHSEREKNKLNNELTQLKGAKDTLSIYGAFMQQLKHRIDQAYAQGRFRKKPKGPIGQFVKVTKEAWGPAIEYTIGQGFLKSFVVDNATDMNTLNTIMKEVVEGTGYQRPGIQQIPFAGKIHNKVHQNETKYNEYHSIYKILEISDPDIANCLIDYRAVESVLLVDNDQVIYGLMQEVGRAPPNCSKCINKLADSFHPAPNYKLYSGLNPRQTHRCKLLQVSITEAQNSIKEQIKQIDEKISSENAQIRALQLELQKTVSQMKEFTNLADAKRKEIGEIRKQLNGLEEELNSHEEFQVPILKDEAKAFEREVQEMESKITQLREETETLQSEVNSAKLEYEESQKFLNGGEDSELSRQHDAKKDQLKGILSEKKSLTNRMAESTQRMSVIEKNIKTCQEEEAAKRTTAENVQEQSKIDDHNFQHKTRDVNTIKNEINIAKQYIKSAEEVVGVSYEQLNVNIKIKEKALLKLEKGVAKISKLQTDYADLVESRRDMLHRQVDVRSTDVKVQFQSVLSMRKYQGKLVIDHDKQEIRIKVVPTDGSRSVDTVSLSGGERSYSAVAFIMALWKVTDIPFYSMDEFDVFMDKVNRKFIIDLLLLTTKKKPQSQFIFLTPQDTSCVTPSENISIFQMQEPERTQNSNMMQ